MVNPLSFDEDAFQQAAKVEASFSATTDPEELGATTSEEPPLEDRNIYEECSQTTNSRVYLVSDQRDVIQASIRRLQTKTAGMSGSICVIFMLMFFKSEIAHRRLNCLHISLGTQIRRRTH